MLNEAFSGGLSAGSYTLHSAKCTFLPATIYKSDSEGEQDDKLEEVFGASSRSHMAVFGSMGSPCG